LVDRVVAVGFGGGVGVGVGVAGGGGVVSWVMVKGDLVGLWFFCLEWFRGGWKELGCYRRR